MGEFLSRWLALTWDMLLDSALLLFVGFFLAGVMRAFITPTVLSRLFGKSSFVQVFTASLIGIPLPLCSCSVLPVAVQLRHSGLSRPGTVSFLISTPETGADSIALSYKLLGPFYAVARPIAALITAMISGLIARFVSGSGPSNLLALNMAPPTMSNAGFIKRLTEGQNYIIKDVIPSLAYYLFWGYLLAGLAAAIVPSDIVQSGVAGWLQYAAVILVSLPVYVCATSSTPLAAVLLSVGVLPGAVLTFLLVGPATNLTSLVVQKQILGLKGTIIMTASIVISAVGIGVCIDTFLRDLVVVPFRIIEGGVLIAAHWYDIGAAAILAIIMLYYTGKKYYTKLK